MQNTMNLIRKVFENHNWEYEFVDCDTFGVELELEGPVNTLRCITVVRENDFACYAYFPNKPEKAAYPRVAEFLHRANTYMPYGNFEFDYNEGEIRYKVFTDFDHCKLSYAVVENALTFPVGVFIAYGAQLLRVMYGNENVERLFLEACENA